MKGGQFKGETQAERRRYKRKPIKLHVHYQCLDKGVVSEPQRDLAEDLGAGGLMMRSQRPLEKDQVLMLVLLLPPVEKRQKGVATDEYIEEESLAVEILCRVAWATSSQDGGYLIGVQFLDLDQNNRKWLKEFLVDFKLDQPDSFLYT
jgi:c-di-GMP-binding flagellar brake protein YcgR